MVRAERPRGDGERPPVATLSLLGLLSDLTDDREVVESVRDVGVLLPQTQFLNACGLAEQALSGGVVARRGGLRCGLNEITWLANRVGHGRQDGGIG